MANADRLVWIDCEMTGLDPETDEPVVDHEQMAIGRNAAVFLGDIPVFFWPYFATDLKDWPTLAPSNNVVSFGEDATGELYVVTRSAGIYRIAPR